MSKLLPLHGQRKLHKIRMEWIECCFIELIFLISVCFSFQVRSHCVCIVWNGIELNCCLTMSSSVDKSGIMSMHITSKYCSIALNTWKNWDKSIWLIYSFLCEIAHGGSRLRLRAQQAIKLNVCVHISDKIKHTARTWNERVHSSFFFAEIHSAAILFWIDYLSGFMHFHLLPRFRKKNKMSG